MRILDILGLAFSTLWQQKVRTVLTTLGVVFGSFVLAASLSISQGVQDTIERESHRTEFLRRIHVRPGWRNDDAVQAEEAAQVPGEMSDAKRARIGQAIKQYKQRFSEQKPRTEVTQARLRALGQMEHVEAVAPALWLSGFAVLGERAQAADVAAAQPDDKYCRQRLVAGRFFESTGEHALVVSEFMLYRWGLTDDKAVNEVLGRKVRLEFRQAQRQSGFVLGLVKNGETTRDEAAALDKVRSQLPAALDLLALTPAEKAVLHRAVAGKSDNSMDLYSEEFPIVGVLRLPTAAEQEGPWDPVRADGDVILPLQTATELYFRVPGDKERGVHQAVATVDREENVKAVLAQIKAMGLEGHSHLEFIERERLMYLLIFGAMSCVAAVALLVAALGIANTMLMSVLERTREIGIMKAVGAGNGQLQMIFLVEGAFIGVIGGCVGLLLAWSASFPADDWVRSMVSRDLKIDLKEPIFVFPAWLAVVVLAFAGIITTLAAVFPARRAAKVDPVAALRHE